MPNRTSTGCRIRPALHGKRITRWTAHRLSTRRMRPARAACRQRKPFHSLRARRRPVADTRIGTFERNLTWWVAGCIVVGILLGKLTPDFFQDIGRMKVAEVNLPVAVLIW